jgi:hypothetical protein
MCSDAVEGLSRIADKKKISGITSELNQKIQQRVEKKEVKVIFLKHYRTPLAVAASIILVIGLVWFFRASMKELDTASSEKIFADKFEPPPSDTKEEQTTAPKEPPRKEQAVRDNNNATSTAQGPLQKEKQSRPDVSAEEKTTEKNYNFKNTGAPAKTHATTASDIKSVDANAAMKNEEVAKNENRAESQKEKDAEKKSAPSAIVPAITTAAGGGASGQPAADKMGTLAAQERIRAKQDDKKIIDDGSAREEKAAMSRVEPGNGDILSNDSGKKSKVKLRKENKEAAPSKNVSIGYYGTQPVTSAAPESQSQVTEAEDISLKTSAPEIIATDSAMSKYDKQDYSGAITDFEKTLKQKPNDEKSLFYSAVSYLSLGQADKAIIYLNKILQNKNGQYYDAAQWYVSLAYIKKNDAQNARRNLIELQNNSNSKYQKQADETLKEMKK